MAPSELWVRLVYAVNVVVPFVFFMAAIYLFLHILFARLIARPDSPMLWFFAVVTGPLTRPIRAMLTPGTSERRVRLVALAAYAGLWLCSRWLLSHWAGSPVR